MIDAGIQKDHGYAPGGRFERGETEVREDEVELRQKVPKTRLGAQNLDPIRPRAAREERPLDQMDLSRKEESASNQKVHHGAGETFSVLPTERDQDLVERNPHRPAGPWRQVQVGEGAHVRRIVALFEAGDCVDQKGGASPSLPALIEADDGSVPPQLPEEPDTGSARVEQNQIEASSLAQVVRHRGACSRGPVAHAVSQLGSSGYIHADRKEGNAVPQTASQAKAAFQVPYPFPGAGRGHQEHGPGRRGIRPPDARSAIPRSMRLPSSGIGAPPLSQRARLPRRRSRKTSARKRWTRPGRTRR